MSDFRREYWREYRRQRPPYATDICNAQTTQTARTRLVNISRVAIGMTPVLIASTMRFSWMGEGQSGLQPPIRCLIYRSMIRLPFGEARVSGLLRILEVSRSRNLQVGITGVLYSEGPRFTQLLEGPPGAVETVFRSIANDERHYDVAVLSRTDCLRREFANWSMALVDEAEYQTALRRLHTIANISHDRAGAFVATMKALLESAPK